MSLHDALERASAAPAGEQLDALLEGVAESDRSAAKAALAGFSSQALSHLPQKVVVTEVVAELAEEAVEEAPAADVEAAPACSFRTSLTEEQLANVQEAFAKIDADHNGNIDLHELGKVMKALGRDMTEEEVAVVFNKVDLDHNGKFEFDEYLKMVEKALNHA